MNELLTNFPFDAKKAAQVAAFFLIKARERGANVTVLKLMKLMYLAERESYKRFAEPMIGDALVSMPHGPVLSNTLNLINSSPEEREGGSHWDEMISDRDGNHLSIRADAPIQCTEDLMELSESDIEILDGIWGQLGKLPALRLRDFTHDPKNCPEWEDPNGSSIPISLDKLLSSMNYSSEAIHAIRENLLRAAYVQQQLQKNVSF